MDMKDPEARDGKECAFWAVMGRVGMSSKHSCVDFMVALFGRRMVIGFVAGLTLMIGMEVWM